MTKSIRTRKKRTKFHPIISGNVVRKRKVVIQQNRRRLLKRFVTAIQELRDLRKKEPTRKDLPKIQSMLQNICNCGHHMQKGKISLCKKPLFCERCMNIRKAELGTTMMDWMDNHGTMYGWVEKIKLSFPRNVIYRNGRVIPLIGFHTEDFLSLELSNNGLHFSDDYSNSFYQTLDALEHGKERLQEIRANLWKRLRCTDGYLGAISELHFLPYGAKGLYVELKTLILTNKKPNHKKLEVKSVACGSTDFHYVMERTFKSKPHKLSSKNILKILDSVFPCDANPISMLCSEEIRNYFRIFLGTKTFMGVGPIFYGTHN